MSEVTHHSADLGEVNLHYVSAGAGPTVVLLHGWPQTWFTWRSVIECLVPDFRIVAPDLRGLGDSSRPQTGYDKKTVASDIARLMKDVLKEPSFHLVGHDWGGAVAYALAAAHPETVRTLTILDVVVPRGDRASFSQNGNRWHHAFHLTEGLPEELTHGREDIYLGWFFRNFGATPNAITDADMAKYIRCYSMPGAMRAGFEYYRALPTDIADNNERPVLEMPVLALGGATSWGRRDEVLNSMRKLARNVTGGTIEGAGHWIPEEQPELLCTELRRFFEKN